MSHSRFDVVVIGSGVGGYPAAVLLAKKGLKVAVIEENRVGGTCVNYGCIPTKTMIYYAKAIKAIERLGLKVSANHGRIIEEARKIATSTSKNIEELLRSSGVELIREKGQLMKPSGLHRVKAGNLVIEARKVVLALGSKPWAPQGINVDNERIIWVDSLPWIEKELDASKIAVVGGGPAGVEIAQALSMLGYNVELYEALPTLLPGLSGLGKIAVYALKDTGVKVYTSTPIEKAIPEDSGARICSSRIAEGCREYDLAIIAIGRKPSTKGVGLELAGVRTDDKGFIIVNDDQSTSVEGIYACGDVAGHPMLAHKAILESLSAARSILGLKTQRPRVIPVVVYTEPQLAYIKDTAAKPLKTRIVKLYWGYSLDSKLRGYKPRLVYIRLTLDEDSGRIVEAEVVGPDASHTAALLALVMEHGLSVREVANVAIPHPTSTEQLFEAALEALGESYNKA